MHTLITFSSVLTNKNSGGGVFEPPPPSKLRSENTPSKVRLMAWPLVEEPFFRLPLDIYVGQKKVNLILRRLFLHTFIEYTKENLLTVI